MNYVRRQRAGSQEFGDKAVREDQADYDLTNYGDNNQNQTL